MGEYADSLAAGHSRSPAQVLDREQIDSLISAAGVEGAREIVEAFNRSTGELLARLKSDLERGDLQEAARTAHALKGSALNVGAVALSSAARIVEDACKTDDVARAMDQVTGAKDHFAETAAAFEDVLSNAA